MPTLEPVELQFTIDNKIDQDAKRLSQSIKGIDDAGTKSREALKGALEAQRSVIKGIEGDITKLEKQLGKMSPGKAQTELVSEVAAAKKALAEEKASLGELDAQLKKNEATTRSYRTQKRLLTEQLIAAEMAGKRGTAEYEALADELGRLTDAMGDAQTQANVLANDNRGLAGLVAMAGGLSGAITAATGTFSLFVGENEKLAAIEKRVQTLMAVTIGLQQVANTLNKDSAFMINTVAKAKQLWAAANVRVAATLGVSTAAATALMATLTLGLSVAVVALVALYTRWSDKQKELAKRQQEMNELHKDSAKTSEQARIEIDLMMNRIAKFNGTKEQEKKLVKELNDKYGEAFGQYKTLAGWYDTLKQKSEDYVRSKFAEAMATQYVAKATELAAQRVEAEERRKQADAKALKEYNVTADNVEMGMANGQGTVTKRSEAGVAALAQNRKNEALAAIDAEIASLDAQVKAQMERALSFQEEYDAIAGRSNLFGNEEPDKKEPKMLYDAAKDLQKQLLAIRAQTAQVLFDQQQDSLQKRLAQIDLEHRAELDKVAEYQQQVVEKYNEANKDKKGFKPLSTQTDEMATSVAAIDPTAAKQAQEELLKMENAYGQKKQAAQRAWAKEAEALLGEVAEAFMNEQQLELKAVRDKYSQMREELVKYQGALTEQQNAAIGGAQKKEEDTINAKWAVERSKAFDLLFQNANRVGSKALAQAMETAKAIVEQYRDQLPEDMLERFTQAIESTQAELDQRNPFKALTRHVGEFTNATDKAAKQQALTGIFESASLSLDMVNQMISGIANTLDQLGLLNEEQKQTVSQVSGMISGASSLAMGIATGNPLQIVQGTIDLVANGMELLDKRGKKAQRDIDAADKMIAKLNRQYRELERITANALGEDIFSSRQAEIGNLNKQIDETINKINAEGSKKKKKRDNSAIQGWIDDIEAAKDKIEDIQRSIFEEVTQTNAKSVADELADALVTAFQQGESAAMAFEEVSSKVLQNAVKNALKLQLLEKPIQAAMDKLMKNMTTTDANGVLQYDKLTEEEAEKFKAELAAIAKTYNEGLKGLDYIFDAGDKADTSLTGSIKGVSEETASALGGQITAIRIAQEEANNVMRQQLMHMSEIAANTRYNIYLEGIWQFLVNNNSSDPLRAKGL